MTNVPRMTALSIARGYADMAVEALEKAADARTATHYVDMAASASTLAQISRAFSAVALLELEEQSVPPRWSSEDIQLRHCHSATFVVRLGTTGRWWHPGSQTYCEDDAPTEIQPTPPVRSRGPRG